MIANEAPGEPPPVDGEARLVQENQQVWEQFEGYQDGIVLSPFRHRAGRWLFEKAWLVMLALVVGLVELALTAVAALRGIVETQDLLLNAFRCVIGPQRVCISFYGPRSLELALWLFASIWFFALPLVVAALVESLLVLRLARKFPRYLYELARAGRLRPGSGEARARVGFAPQDWRTYRADLEAAMWSPLRYPFFLFWFFLIYGFSYLVGSRVGAFLPFGHPLTNTSNFFFFILGPGVMAFFVAAWLWVPVVFATYIHGLVPAFELDILPWHWDRSGGLRQIGDLSLHMAVLVMPFTLVFVYWVLYVVQGLPVLSGPGIMIYSSLLILAALAGFAFFRPLWRIHREMTRKKESYIRDEMTAVRETELRLRELAVSDRLDSQEARELGDKLGLLRQIYPPGFNFPVWPFDSQVLYLLITSMIIPVLGLVVGLIALNK